MANFKPVMVVTTLPDQTRAENLGTLLLERQLAACVQYESITSQYLWQGEICCDAEIRVTIKTSRHLYREIQKHIVQHHPYACPQILMLPVNKGFAPYLRWLRQVLGV